MHSASVHLSDSAHLEPLHVATLSFIFTIARIYAYVTCHTVDRKAFFAVVSVLIDPSTVPEGEKLTEENYEAYLPAQHKRLLDVLKA